MASNGRFPASGQTVGPIADPEQNDDAVSKSYMLDQGYAVASAVASALAAKADLSHTHAQSDITNLVSDLAGKAASVHTHAQSDITNLVSALAGKASSSHTHSQSDITNLVSDLAGKAASVHTHAGLPVLFRLNADSQNSSNSSFTNIFSQAVLANEVWSFECIVYFLTAASTTGLVVQVDSPASPAASQISFTTFETATVIRNLTGAQGVALVGTAGLATVLEARVSGTIENGSNAGNIILKFRSEVNASAVTAKRGSWGRFYKH